MRRKYTKGQKAMVKRFRTKVKKKIMTNRKKIKKLRTENKTLRKAL